MFTAFLPLPNDMTNGATPDEHTININRTSKDCSKEKLQQVFTAYSAKYPKTKDPNDDKKGHEELQDLGIKHWDREHAGKSMGWYGSRCTHVPLPPSARAPGLGPTRVD